MIGMWGLSARWRVRSLVAFVLAIAAATVGSTGVAPPAASAAALPAGFTSPQPPLPLPPPDVRAPLPAATREALVTAAIRTYGISEQQAQHDADVQYRAPEIVNKLQQTLGSGYAGVWFDMKAGKFMIDVAPTTDRGGVSQVESYFGIGADSKQVPVTYTWAQLNAVQAQWQPRAASLPASDLATVGISAPDNAVVVSTAANAPAADTSALTASVAASNATGSGPPVKFVRSKRTSPPTKTACSVAYDPSYGQNDAYCDAPLRGGVGIQNNASGCTTGFLTYVPWLNGGAGGYDMMTAGHCVAGNGSSWSTYQADTTSFRWIGPPAGWYVDGRGDAALLNITGPYFCYSFSGHCNGSNASGYNVEYAVYQSCSGNPGCAYNENYPINGAASSYYNLPVCWNGRFTTTSCAYDDVSYWIDITAGGTGHSTFTDDCAVEGDSGSAVYWANTGYGILWGTSCPSSNGSWYTEVQPALAAFGLNGGDI